MTPSWRSPMARVAALLDCTEGQAYSLLIGVVVAAVLAATGIPSVLRARSTSAANAAATGVTPLATTSGNGGRASSPTVPPSVAPTASAGVAAPPNVPNGSAFGPSSPPSAAVAPAAPAEPAPAAGSPAPTAPVVGPPGTISVFAPVPHPGVPGGLAVGPDGSVYATTGNGTAHGAPGPSHVFAYDASGAQTADRAIDGQPRDHADGLAGAAVDPITGEVLVVDPDSARIVAVDMATGAQHVRAVVPDLPACLISLAARPCQQGAQDRKPFPDAALSDAAGTLYVSDPAQDTVWRLRRGDRSPTVWLQSNLFASGDGPFGLAFNGGALELTVGTTLDPSSVDAGGLYRAVINADGSAGVPTLVAPFARGDEPGALAIGRSGTAYVVVRHTGAIVSIAPSGSRAGGITPPADGPIPIDHPSALALVPGALLVANGATSDDPTRWAILAITIEDGPER